MVWAYWPTLSAGTIYEDIYVVNVKTWADVIQGWWLPQPTLASFLLTPTPFTAHLGNIGLHGLNGLFLWAILRRLASPVWAWTALTAFWLHPIQTEAVAYLAARGELLVALAALVGLSALLFVRSALLAAGIAVLMMAFGLLCKLSSGASLLLWMPLIGLTVGRLGWLWAAEGIAVLVACSMQPHLFAPLSWMARQSSALWHLARLVVYPVGLSLETPPAVWPWLAFGALLLAMGVAIHSRWRVSALWVTAAILPRLVIQQPAPLIPGPFHEHHVYTTVIGVCLAGVTWPR